MLPLAREEQGNFHPPLRWAAHGLRLGLFAAGCTLGLVAYDALGSALSLLGGEPDRPCQGWCSKPPNPHPTPDAPDPPPGDECIVSRSCGACTAPPPAPAGLGSISCSLVLPTVFYMLLAWRHSSPAARCALVTLLALGAGLVVLVTGMNVCELSERCSGRHAGGSGTDGG